MDRDQICSIACAENKNTYSAPGVSHPRGADQTRWVGGWPVTHFTIVLAFVPFQNNPQNVREKIELAPELNLFFF